MNIGVRLETIAKMVPKGASFADIGTDHAYLPVFLLSQDIIDSAIAGDIAAGPCQAAKTTISMYGFSKKIEVRQGSGLEILKPGEADVIAIAGMGAGTIIDILEAKPDIAKAAQLLLQPMTGADALRAWLVEKGWEITDEELALENAHLYDIISAKYTGISQAPNGRAERLIGSINLKKQHPLLAKQFAKQEAAIKKLLNNMSHSKAAMESDKYKDLCVLLKELEALSNESNPEGCNADNE